jgi:hypothetical protein
MPGPYLLEDSVRGFQAALLKSEVSCAYNHKKRSTVIEIFDTL